MQIHLLFSLCLTGFFNYTRVLMAKVQECLKSKPVQTFIFFRACIGEKVDRKAAKELAFRLQYLPLALGQASAYISQSRMPIEGSILKGF